MTLFGALRGYLLLGSVIVSITSAGGVFVIYKTNQDLRAKITRQELALMAWQARAANTKEDAQSDATVDDLPDLSRVPDPRWLLPSTPGDGSVY